MKPEECRQMEVAALESEIDTKRRELMNIRCKVALGEEVRPHLLKDLRKDIARMKTALNEKLAVTATEGGDN